MDTIKEQLIREVFSKNLFARLLGLQLQNIEEGSITIALEVRDELRQAQGLLHGGATATLIDTATGFACATLVEPGERFSTIDLTVYYLRPVVEGKVICTAKIKRAGKKIITLDAEVADSDGKIVASALTSYARF
ncbi:MAG: PaaI family thioesterase [Pyrinomonadaceae bacterium]